MLGLRSDDLDMVFDTSPARIAYLDSSGRCRYANRAFRDWYGIADGSLAGNDIEKIGSRLCDVTAERRDRVLAGETVTFRREAIAFEGAPCALDVTLIPEVGDDGAVAGIFVFSVDAANGHHASQAAPEEPEENNAPKFPIHDATLEKREIALAHVEQRYELAAHSARVGVWDWNLDTGDFFVDPGLLDLIGYGPGEIPATSLAWLLLVHAEDRDAVEEAAQIHKDGRAPEFICEHRKVHKDGTVRWFLARGQVVPSSDGVPHRMIGTDFDITELKQTQAALLESEERYRRVVEVSPDPVVVHRGGVFLYGNPSAVTFFGVKDQSEISGRDVLDFMHPDEHDLILSRRERRESGLDPLEPQEFRYRVTDGTTRVGESSIARIPWDGEIAALSIIRDITERRRMEDALRESEEFLRLVTNNVPALISYIGADGRFRFVNRNYEDWFGLPESEIVGQVSWDFLMKYVSEDDADRVRQELKSSIQAALSGRVTSFEALRPYTTGITRHIRATLAPHYGGSPVPTGACAMIWDITELKERETQLRVARDEAERANKSKSRFLASASHDLRQPLQALNLLTFALSEGTRTDDDRELVRDMKNALGAMESVLNGLIDISKLDAGVVTADLCDISVDHLFDQMRSSFGLQAQERGLDLRFVPTGYVVRSDPNLLARILENLVSNAIKYTLSGRVLVGCRRRGDEVGIAVYDMGVGIPPDQTDQIFEEFFQIDNAARDRTKGLGLGLAIVNRTARLLNHRIEVRSIPGRGSAFTVIAPLAAGATVAAAPMLAPASACDISRNRILVIEDDENVRRATERLLRRWGADVAAVRSADQAFEMIAETEFQPDIIIADYNLAQHETGLKAIQCLRDALGYQVSGIIITGDTAPTRVREARLAGFELLHKPVNPVALRELIGSLVDESTLR